MVKVIVVEDGKKVFEQEGEFFAGTVVVNGGKDIIAASAAVFGEANARDATIVLAKLAADTVREASLNRMECIINLKALEEILHSWIIKELAGLPQGLAEKIQKIVED